MGGGLKFEFVFTINNEDCDTSWSMSMSTCMDNLLGIIRPIIMMTTIIRIKNKARRWTLSLTINSWKHVCVSGGDTFSLDLFIFYKVELPRMV